MKLFAIIQNKTVVDGWIATSYEEALLDNPNSTIIEVTLENGPWFIGNKYKI